MALLNVDFPMTDPDFTDSFTVDRRTEIVDNHGRGTITHQYFPNVIGVVTSGSPNDLSRREDYEVMARSITVVCRFRLRGETSGEQPDVVIWRGSHYLVRYVDLYPQFGSGFVQAECTSIDRVDPAVEKPSPGAGAFNQASNAIISQL